MRLSPAQWLTAFVLTIAALVVPSSAVAQVAGGVGYRVDQAAGSSLEEGFLTITAPAGQSAAGYFFMTNTSKRSAQMRIYSADGLTGVTTGVVYGSAGDPLQEAGAWMTPSIRTAVLGAESERRIDFSVRVPPGAKAGDHVGSIVLEQNGQGSVNVSQIVRNVVPIRIVVPGNATPQIVPRTAKIEALPGTTMPAIVVSMRNSGLRLCAPTLSVSLKGPSEGGQSVSRQLDTILPGDRIPFPLPWPRSIEPGSYIARVTLSGCGSTETITVELDAPDLSTTTAGTGTGSDAGKPPSVVTDAQPGDSVYRAGEGTPRRSSGSGSGSKKNKAGDLSNVSGEGTAGSTTPGGGATGSGPGSGGGAGSGAGAGTGKGGGVGDWVGNAADTIAKAAPEVIKRATIPLLLLALIGLLFFIQEAIDRRDPKLALAPLHREPHLPFDPNPLHARIVRAAVPSSTALRTDP